MDGPKAPRAPGMQFENKHCFNCSVVGHTARVYPNMKKKQNYLEAADNDAEEEVTIFSFNTKGGQPNPMPVRVCIDGIKLVMGIESGAAISAILEKCYLNKFPKYTSW